MRSSPASCVHCWGTLPVRQRVDDDGVANRISAEIRGQVVHARDIKGGVTF